MNKQFEIKILKQDWLGSPEEDLCSHGEIYLNVNGVIITQSGIDEDWGISESALALLRTLDGDYICDPDNDWGLILHGCGTILMMGCPISIHWTVKHLGDQVRLSDFVKVATTDHQTGSIYYPGLKVTISTKEYKELIVSFAIQAKKLFKDSKEKQIDDDFDEEMYESFWDEYNELLELYSQEN
ncbi:hypothetical protein [Priestia abyssalis]|uniref:hypothetical protein n=1 Tax=Priestia abyssalis TaxID=1221450 RepID=UPI000995965C|nr:hypothetical protein [Priestia abyssalis]